MRVGLCHAREGRRGFFPEGTIGRVWSGSRWVWSHKKSPIPRNCFPYFSLGFSFRSSRRVWRGFFACSSDFRGYEGEQNSQLPNPLEKQRRRGSDYICCDVSLVSECKLGLVLGGGISSMGYYLSASFLRQRDGKQPRIFFCPLLAKPDAV